MYIFREVTANFLLLTIKLCDYGCVSTQVQMLEYSVEDHVHIDVDHVHICVSYVHSALGVALAT